VCMYIVYGPCGVINGLVHVMRIHPRTLLTVILPLVHRYNYEQLIFVLDAIA
jgi:hypothetical protein